MYRSATLVLATGEGQETTFSVLPTTREWVKNSQHQSIAVQLCAQAGCIEVVDKRAFHAREPGMGSFTQPFQGAVHLRPEKRHVRGEAQPFHLSNPPTCGAGSRHS